MILHSSFVHLQQVHVIDHNPFLDQNILVDSFVVGVLHPLVNLNGTRFASRLSPSCGCGCGVGCEGG